MTQEPARKTSPKPPWNYGAGGTMGRGVFQVTIFNFSDAITFPAPTPVSWLVSPSVGQ